MPRGEGRKKLGVLSIAIGAVLSGVGPPRQLSLTGFESTPHIREVRQQQFPAPTFALDLAAISNLAALALCNGRVLVWRIDTGEAIHELTFPAPDSELRDPDEVEPIRMHFAPNGRTLAVSFLSRIHLFETRGWREIGSLEVQGEDDVRPPPRPELKRRADRGDQRTPQQMGRDFERRLARGDGATRITDFAFSRDGSMLLAAYCRGAYYDYPNFSVASASGRDPVRLWQLPSGRLLWERLYDPKDVVERVTPSPDGTHFVEVSRRHGGGSLAMCDLANGQCANSLPLPREEVLPSLFFTPKGRYLIIGLPGVHKAGFTVLDPSDGRTVAEFPKEPGFNYADISPDGRWLVASTPKGMEILIWDVAARKLVVRKPLGWRAVITKVRFDPSGRFIVALDGGKGVAVVYAFYSVQ